MALAPRWILPLAFGSTLFALTSARPLAHAELNPAPAPAAPPKMDAPAVAPAKAPGAEPGKSDPGAPPAAPQKADPAPASPVAAPSKSDPAPAAPPKPDPAPAAPPKTEPAPAAPQKTEPTPAAPQKTEPLPAAPKTDPAPAAPAHSTNPAAATPAPAAVIPAPIPGPVLHPASEHPGAATASQSGPGETDEELKFVELVNQERVRRGLSHLSIDPLLITVARKHSAEMRDKDYFNHNSPTAALKTPLDRYMHDVGAKPSYACVGENLFYCTIVDVDRGHNAFMNSPTHRENLLFPRYERIGVGIVKSARGEFWVTEMFVTNADPALRLASRHN